jgi:hypothetical protein
MPGISAIGDFISTNKRHASAGVLPPEARALSRLIRTIGDVTLGVELLTGVVEDAILAKVKEILPIIAAEKGNDDRLKEHRIALAVDQAIQSVAEEADDDHGGELSNDEGNTLYGYDVAGYRKTDSDTDESLAKKSKVTSTETSATTALPMVSDMSSVEETAASLLRDFKQSKQLTIPDKTEPKNIWSRLLESLHLAVCTRTTKTWGRKKIYEVYQLSGGPVNIRGKSCYDIANMVNAEFRNIYHGGGEDQSGCRVYIQEYENMLYLQVCIGKPFDYTDVRNRSSTGEKKKKKANEFVVICQDESDLIAVTASRAPSGSRFTPYVLSALDIVLSGGVKQASDKNTGMLEHCLSNLTLGMWCIKF